MNEEERKSIKNLKKYIEEDGVYKKTLKYYSDFDKFCYNHCKDIDTVLILVEKLQKEIDLCEETEIALNNRIMDLEEINKEHQKLNGELREEIERQGNIREIEEKYIEKNFNIIRIYDEFKEK